VKTEKKLYELFTVVFLVNGKLLINVIILLTISQLVILENYTPLLLLVESEFTSEKFVYPL
jgi:hypothetical protein